MLVGDRTVTWQWILFIPDLDSFITVTKIEVQICFFRAFQNTFACKLCILNVMWQITNAYFYCRGFTHEMWMV
jgi:hypothetical protein